MFGGLSGPARDRARRLGAEGLAKASEVLRTMTANLSPSNARTFKELVEEGASLEFVYAGILGKEPHIRVVMVTAEGARVEMLRITI